MICKSDICTLDFVWRYNFLCIANDLTGHRNNTI